MWAVATGATLDDGTPDAQRLGKKTSPELANSVSSGINALVVEVSFAATVRYSAVPIMPRVRLTHKFAAFIAGVDLRHLKAGATVDVTPSQARELVNGGWATPQDAPSASKTPAKNVKTKLKRRTRKRSG